MRLTSTLIALPVLVALACNGGGSTTTSTDTTDAPATTTGTTTDDPTATPTTTTDTTAAEPTTTGPISATDTSTSDTSTSTTDVATDTSTTDPSSTTGDSSSSSGDESSTGEPVCASLQLDGVDDYIEVAAISLPVLTVEAWVWPAGFGGQRAVVTQLNSSDPKTAFTGFELGMEGDVPYFIIGDGKAYQYLNADATIGAGKWAHLAAMYDGTTGTLAINGKLEAKTLMGKMVQPDIAITIGNRPSLSFLFNGLLSEVRISKVVRHVADFVPTFTNANDADTVALWHLDEAAGAVAGDSSGNDHTGDIKGDAVWSDQCPAG